MWRWCLGGGSGCAIERWQRGWRLAAARAKCHGGSNVALIDMQYKTWTPTLKDKTRRATRLRPANGQPPPALPRTYERTTTTGGRAGRRHKRRLHEYTATAALATRRHTGVLGSCFIDCCRWSPPQRLVGCESRAQTLLYMQRLREEKPTWNLHGYDDWCRVARSLQLHQPRGLTSIRGVVGLLHAKSHRRKGCRTEVSADMR